MRPDKHYGDKRVFTKHTASLTLTCGSPSAETFAAFGDEQGVHFFSGGSSDPLGGQLGEQVAPFGFGVGLADAVTVQRERRANTAEGIMAISKRNCKHKSKYNHQQSFSPKCKDRQQPPVGSPIAH